MPQCMLGYHPPWEQTPPPPSMLGDTVNLRAVRILLECILVYLMVIGQLIFRFTVNKYRRNEFVCFNEKTKTRTQSEEHAKNTASWIVCTCSC